MNQKTRKKREQSETGRETNRKSGMELSGADRSNHGKLGQAIDMARTIVGSQSAHLDLQVSWSDYSLQDT
jgi:hypothetical protein